MKAYLEPSGNFEVGTEITPKYYAEFFPGSYTYGPDTNISVIEWSIFDNITGHTFIAENVNQIEHCEEYAKSKGYELAGVYSHTGSGLNTNNPVLNDLRADAAAGKFDTVVVFDVSRISRNALAVRAFLDEMQRHGVTVESVKEPIGGNALWQLKRIK